MTGGGGGGEKNGERSRRNNGLGAASQSPDRLALAPLLETFRFEDENDYEDYL